MGWAVIHSEKIWVARLFRRNATMLTHYAVYLVRTDTLLKYFAGTWQNTSKYISGAGDNTGT